MVLFVGRLVRKKGVHIIAQLVQRFPGITWVVVGSGPELLPANQPNLQVIRRVEHDRLPLFYQAADLLVLPSSGEGFPLVVQEALCCGTGVLSTEEVATACPPAAAWIRTRPTPRTDDDVGGWEDALRSTLADQQYMDGGAERSRLARELWSWDQCIARYMQILGELTA